MPVLTNPRHEKFAQLHEKFAQHELCHTSHTEVIPANSPTIHLLLLV
jgi:hypothetical protein